ncbi:hypothetical protein I5907_11715 [Panacibacter sp. DH6]|uniref:Uncharacterized protein n=1 Tax=Panacibacter microcysteis TaxID=2793269 RepID=A0A931E4I6_9BACT|nr:hypothetical protein [Panacibacter microcysteis]MBG9376908.1 hypothetical protein [Panacibacter microcysteis]
MYKPLLTLLVAASLFAGCSGNTAKDNTGDSAATTAPVDTASPATQAEDPDPSDSIAATAYGINTYGKATEQLVRARLLEKFKDDLAKDLVDSFSRRFIFFQYDLNNDNKKEIFVGLTGPYFCGSGGCSIELLNADGTVINSFTVTDYPVIVAGTATNGWQDLILESNGKYHLIKFNGKSYPANPSVAPVMKEIPGDGLPRLLNYMNEPYAWFRF